MGNNMLADDNSSPEADEIYEPVGPQPSSAEIQEKLDACKARLGVVERSINESENKLAKLKRERYDLMGGGFSSSWGMIRQVQNELNNALLREETARLTPVRLEQEDQYDEKRVFLKKTAKRIYLRGVGRCGEYIYDLSGKRPWSKPIHQEDLQKILSGEIK